MSTGTKTAQLKVNVSVASPSINSHRTQQRPVMKNYNSTSTSTSPVSSPFSKPQASTGAPLRSLPSTGPAPALNYIPISSPAPAVTASFSTPQVSIGTSTDPVQSSGSGVQISAAKFIPNSPSPPAAVPSFSKPQILTGPIAMFGEIKNGMTSSDTHTKRKREEEDDEKYVDTGNTTRAKTASNSLPSVRESFVDGYTFALQECLKFVPKRRKTQCIIEMLQVIQKYELHEE